MKELQWKHLTINEIHQTNVSFILPLHILKEIYGNNIKIIKCIEDNKTIAYFYYYERYLYSYIKRIQAPLFLPYNELIIIKKDTPVNKANYHKFLKDILFSLSNYLKEHYGSAIITITLSPFIIDTQPFFWNKMKVIPYYTYQINLKQPIEEISKHFDAKKRNQIKKAQKDNLKIIEENDFNVLINSVLCTFERKNKALDKLLLKKFIEITHSNNLLKIYTCINNNEKIASAGFLLSNNKIYYLFSGFNPKMKHSGSIPLLIYYAIQEAQKQNIEIFDFEGSMLPDVEKSFREFGGDIIPYYSINKAPLWIEMILKIFQRNRF